MASNIVFDGTKGISLPSFTTTEKNAIVSPATGAVVYDSTLKQESLYNGSAWVNVNASGNSAITSGTAQASTSGTSIDFTSIPSWVKRITVMFSGVSTNGSSNLQIQIGAGSVVTTGYNSIASQLNSSSMSTSGSNTSGFVLTYSTLGSTSLCSGQIVFTNQTGNSWVESGLLSRGDAVIFVSAGNATALSGALDRIRITTVNGTDTFDAGSINILYE